MSFIKPILSVRPPGPTLGPAPPPPWVPTIGGVLATSFADFTTEGTTNHYWANGVQQSSAAVWRTAVNATFTRASIGSFTNSSGLVAQASSGVLRFDYDPVLLTSKGILLEGGSTNLVTHSQGAFSSSWTTSQGGNGGATDNATTAPDGTTTASLLFPSVAVSDQCRASPSITASANTIYAFSVFAKQAGYKFACVNWSDNTAMSYTIIVDLSLGTIVGNIADFGVPTNLTTNVVNVGNGWFRITLAFQSSGGVTTASAALAAQNTSTPTHVNSRPTSAGNGVDGCYFWGAQFEQMTFATSYIPTVASTVPRQPESFSIPFATSVGTIYCQHILYAEGTSFDRIVGGNDVDTNTPILTDGTTSIATYNTVSALDYATPVTVIGVLHKTAVSGNSSSRLIDVDGGVATVSATAFSSVPLSKLFLAGSSADANPGYMNIYQFGVWSSTLATAAQLQRLTT